MENIFDLRFDEFNSVTRSIPIASGKREYGNLPILVILCNIIKPDICFILTVLKFLDSSISSGKVYALDIFVQSHDSQRGKSHRYRGVRSRENLNYQDARKRKLCFCPNY